MTQMTQRLTHMIRRIGLTLLAGVFLGIFTGIAARLIMRIVAIVYPERFQGFTLEGTGILLLFGTGISLAMSLLFSVLKARLSRSWVKQGLIFGFLLLLCFGIPLFCLHADGELAGPQRLLGISLFLPLIVISSLLLAKVVHTLENKMPSTKSVAMVHYASFTLLILPAILFLVNLVSSVLTSLQKF
ncbi:MAG: hypothetical protein ACM32O_12820 [Clostridia bacterium]